MTCANQKPIVISCFFYSFVLSQPTTVLIFMVRLCRAWMGKGRLHKLPRPGYMSHRTWCSCSHAPIDNYCTAGRSLAIGNPRARLHSRGSNSKKTALVKTGYAIGDYGIDCLHITCDCIMKLALFHDTILL